MLIDPELGIATDYLDTEHRVKASTIKKNVLRRKMELDSLGGGAARALCCHDPRKGKTDYDRNRPESWKDSGKIQPDSACRWADSLYHSFRCSFLSGLGSYVYRAEREWPSDSGKRNSGHGVCRRRTGVPGSEKEREGRFGGTGSESGIRRQFRKTSAGSSWLCLSLCRGCDAAYKDVGIGTEKNGTAHR